MSLSSITNKQKLEEEFFSIRNRCSCYGPFWSKILSYCSFEDLCNFRQVSRKCYSIVAESGGTTFRDVQNRLNSLEKTIVAISSIIPSNKLTYKGRFLPYLDSISSLKQVKTWTAHEFIICFSSPEFYESTPNTFLQYLRKLYPEGRVPSFTEQQESLASKAVFVASSIGSLEAIIFLKEMGCELNQKDEEGFSVFAYAVLSGNETLVAFLLEQRVAINTFNIRGNTPLIHACVNPPILKLILESEDGYLLINHQNKFGDTALDLAKEENIWESVELLREKGALEHPSKN